MNLENLEARTMLAAVKIMPLGDSITEGFSGHASYRFFLYNQLKNAGYDIDFVGSLNGVNGGAPLYSNFDQNHEGRSGIRTDEIQANIINWANQNKPDVVLLHTGSNDVEQGQSNTSTITELGGLIDNLRSVVPNVKIVLAQVIPETGFASSWPDLNSKIATLASQKTTQASPIILVDQYTGFNANSDTYDGTHPNESGERKMSAKWFSALQSILPAPTPQNVVYLSDLNPTSASNGWGPIERDRSNNETGPTDGKTIALNGIGYLKGLGTHSTSDTTYSISGGSYSSFNADIGVDDEVGGNGGVVFQVYVDGSLKYTSPKMTGNSGTQQVNVPLASNNTSLRLVVTDGGDGNAYDHADWANARLTVGAPVTPPGTPSGLGATYNSSTGKIDLNWTDTAGDEVGFRVERKAGAGGTFSQIAEIATPNTSSYTDNGPFAIGTTYYYRVVAYKSGATSGFSNEANASVPAPAGTTYVSDLNPSSQTNQWGNFERDRSNGEQGPADGRTITLNGVTYAKGLGVHAQSELTYNIANAGFTQFQADIGLDDEVGNNGSVFFQVYVGNSLVYSSPRMTGASATIPVTVAIPGDASTLRLVVTPDGDASFDHADWANARLLSGTVVPPPTGTTYASDRPYTVNANGWGTAEKDRSNGEQGPTDGRTITLNGVTYQKGIGVHAASDISFNIAGTGFTQFRADLGVDDEVGNNGSVVFQVYFGNTLVYTSPRLTGLSSTVPIALSIPGGTSAVRLVVNDSGDGATFDHADWADARFLS